MKRRTDKAMTQGAKPQGQRTLHGLEPEALEPEAGDLPAPVRLGRRGKQAEDAELLADLRQAARRLGQESLGASEYRRHGGYSPGTVVRRFGSWNAAVERAGLKAPAQASDEQLLEDLRQVARRLGRDRLGQTEYNRHGRYNNQMIARRFGSWGKAVERAALGTAGHPHADPDAIFYNLLAAWVKLGRRPSSGEMRRPVSKFSIRPYLYYFGTWRKAMAAFFAWIREREPPGAGDGEPQYPPGTVLVRPGKEDLPPRPTGHKTQRKPTLRQRFRVMLRDHFRCRLCGRSPAATPGLELNIDHVVAWSKGGETVDENLQTLCSDCNHGKFDQ